MWEWGSFNGEGYQPIIAKPALGIGRLWHQTQAEWSLHPEVDPNELLLTLSNKEIERIQQEYLLRIGAPISQAELDSTYTGIELLIGMVHNYKTHWGSPLPDGFTMVSPEQTCVVPIPGSQHVCEYCKGRGFVSTETSSVGTKCPQCQGKEWDYHYLSGTLDGLIKDQNGLLYVLERKTYGARPKPETLNMQDQFLAYLWILWQLRIGDIGGLAYDGAWKRKEPPRGSALGDLFLRVRLTRNRNELVRFGEQLNAIVREIADPNHSIYINRKWDGCWDCDFQEPCIAQERGEDYNYLLNARFTKRDLAEDSTRELKYDAA